MNKHCFKVRNTPDNLHKLQSSYNVENVTVNGAFIEVYLIPITRDFIQTKQLTLNYIKKHILT